MSIEDLDALIIRNIGYVDVAKKRLENELSDQIASSIDEIVSEWASKQDWRGQHKWSEQRNLWVAPSAWGVEGATDDDSDWFGYFEFADLGEDGGSLWLARLCDGKMGFQWRWSTALGVTKPRWKKFIQGKPRILEEIQKHYFNYQDSGYFACALKIESSALASGIVDGSFEEAFAPLRRALNILLEIRPRFDDLLELAKKNTLHNNPSRAFLPPTCPRRGPSTRRLAHGRLRRL